MIKRISILFFLLAVLMSCDSSSKGNKSVSKAAQTVTNKKEPQTNETPATEFQGAEKLLTTSYGAKIPVYKFEAFEKAYLQNKDKKTYVLNFWATWCIPCVKELPYFFEAEEGLKEQEVVFTFVSLDFVSDLEKKLLPFMEKRKITSEVVVLDQKGVNEWLGKINEKWDGAIPATLIYNKDQSVFHREKFETTADVKTVIEEVLN